MIRLFRPKKWEYIHTHDGSIDNYQKLGEDGWEGFAVSGPTHIFRRPK